MSILSVIAALLSIGILGAGLGDAAQLDCCELVPEHLCRAARAKPEAESVVGARRASCWLLIGSVRPGTLFLYLCMALGHLAKKHRVIMAVVWYFVLTTVLQFLLMLFLMSAGTLPLQRLLEGAGTLSSAAIGPSGYHPHRYDRPVPRCTAAVGAVFFLATRYILKNKLNLE